METFNLPCMVLLYKDLAMTVLLEYNNFVTV